MAADSSASPVSTPSDAVVKVRNLSKIYDSLWGATITRGLANASFEVRRGEIFGLVGPAASGKTTTLKILSGRLGLTEGSITVFGRSPRRRAVQARIGCFVQKSNQGAGWALPPESGVPGRTAGNAGQASGADAAQVRGILARLLFCRPERPLASDHPLEGQARIALARAFLKDPDLVLLDEPFTELDSVARRQMKDLILVHARKGKTVILSSQSLLEVKDVCDRVAIYYGGNIEAIGTLAELLAAPRALRFLAPVIPPEVSERLLQAVLEDLSSSGEAGAMSLAHSQGDAAAHVSATDMDLASARVDQVLAQLVKAPPLAPTLGT